MSGAEPGKEQLSQQSLTELRKTHPMPNDQHLGGFNPGSIAELIAVLIPSPRISEIQRDRLDIDRDVGKGRLPLSIRNIVNLVASITRYEPHGCFIRQRRAINGIRNTQARQEGNGSALNSALTMFTDELRSIFYPANMKVGLNNSLAFGLLPLKRLIN